MTTTPIQAITVPNDAASLAHSPRAETFYAQQGLPVFSQGAADMIDDGAPEGSEELAKRFLGFHSADGIAAAFRGLGIKGYRGDLNSCPIATYARTMVGDCEVSTDGISLQYFSKSTGETQSMRLSATEAMKQFVINFDNGLYPDLVAA